MEAETQTGFVQNILRRVGSIASNTATPLFGQQYEPPW